MIIERDHENFDETLELAIDFMRGKGVEVGDVDVFKSTVTSIEFDEETNEITLCYK